MSTDVKDVPFEALDTINETSIRDCSLTIIFLIKAKTDVPEPETVPTSVAGNLPDIEPHYLVFLNGLDLWVALPLPDTNTFDPNNVGINVVKEGDTYIPTNLPQELIPNS